MPSVEMLARIKELETENERLKYALKQRTAQSDANANLWMKELRTGAKQEKEIEQLRKENAKLKCLALHGMIGYAACKMNLAVPIEFSKWHQKKIEWTEAYRKAKKALKEGK